MSFATDCVPAVGKPKRACHFIRGWIPNQEYITQQFTALKQQLHAVLFTKMRRSVDGRTGGFRVRAAGLRGSTLAFVPGHALESAHEHENIVRLIGTGAPLDDIDTAARRYRSATLDAYLVHEHPDETIGLPAY